MEKTRKAYSTIVGNTETKIPLGELVHTWEYNIKTNLK